VIKPLGRVLTSLPIGEHFPGLNAGPCFELQPKEFISLHREEAFMILQERIVELATYSDEICKDCQSPDLQKTMSLIKQSLLTLAKGLQLDSG
jgi:hypothetical protein